MTTNLNLGHSLTSPQGEGSTSRAFVSSDAYWIRYEHPFAYPSLRFEVQVTHGLEAICRKYSLSVSDLTRNPKDGFPNEEVSLDAVIASDSLSIHAAFRRDTLNLAVGNAPSLPFAKQLLLDLRSLVLVPGNTLPDPLMHVFAFHMHFRTEGITREDLLRSVLPFGSDWLDQHQPQSAAVDGMLGQANVSFRLENSQSFEQSSFLVVTAAWKAYGPEEEEFIARFEDSIVIFESAFERLGLRHSLHHQEP